MPANDAHALARLRGLAANPSLSGEPLLRMLALGERVRPFVFSRPMWTDAAFETLATHPDNQLRGALAEAPGITPAQRARLAADPAPFVRVSVILGPFRYRWELGKPLMPHEAYARLADDPHPNVRLMFDTCDHAPADLLPSSAPRPAPDPEELAEAARDEYAPRRAWAARAAAAAGPRCGTDPDAPPALIDRLSRDEEPIVRGWVASDPRLSPARILQLLDEPTAAGRAAANPSLPEPTWERIFTDAA
ncbi:hypothetical protein [Dactylosporangium sp. CS-033363]|uniref:hypothetical protein n=1 Tax=Dactylosporangium sp. CS-033363 TaxID=3239935 RepID=UPI003D949010